MTKDERRTKFLEEHPQWSSGALLEERLREGNFLWKHLEGEEKRWKRRRKGTMAKL